MRSFYKTLSIFFLALTLCFTVTPVYAQSLKEVKASMASRLPTINALKTKGIIGENNQGLLEFRASDKSEQALVDSENKDRKMVYAAIARKQGVSASLVGQRRAKAVAAKGKKGHWYQDSSGSWYKK